VEVSGGIGRGGGGQSVEGLAEGGGGGGQWRDWQRGVEDTEWRPVEGLAEWGWRTLSGGQWRDWQRGVEDTERRPVEGLAEGVEDTERRP
ncbi:unnamed protein product, partial [Staurois parvus]